MCRAVLLCSVLVMFVVCVVLFYACAVLSGCFRCLYRLPEWCARACCYVLLCADLIRAGVFLRCCCRAAVLFGCVTCCFGYLRGCVCCVVRFAVLFVVFRCLVLL